MPYRENKTQTFWEHVKNETGIDIIVDTQDVEVLKTFLRYCEIRQLSITTKTEKSHIYDLRSFIVTPNNRQKIIIATTHKHSLDKKYVLYKEICEELRKKNYHTRKIIPYWITLDSLGLGEVSQFNEHSKRYSANFLVFSEKMELVWDFLTKENVDMPDYQQTQIIKKTPNPYEVLHRTLLTLGCACVEDAMNISEEKLMGLSRIDYAHMGHPPPAEVGQQKDKIRRIKKELSVGGSSEYLTNLKNRLERLGFGV